MRTPVFVLLALAVAADAVAGHVYGTIFFNGQPLANALVFLKCPGETSEGSTDSEGVYRVFAQARGDCQIALDSNGRRASAAIYSYDRPTGYDFDLVMRNGRWELIRR
jgi:hypothetical protein